MGVRRVLKLTNQGQVEFFEDSAGGTNKIAIKAPATLAGDLIWILPGNDVLGFLRNDGAGILTWANSTTTMQTAYDGGDQITLGAGGSIGITGPLAQDSQILVLTQQANQHALVISKTATGANNAVQIDDAGTGIALNIGKTGGTNPAAFITVSTLAATGLSITQNTAAVGIVISQVGNEDAIRIAKTGTGAGSCLDIDDDGTDPAIKIQKDGNGVGIDITMAAASGNRAILVTQAGDFNAVRIFKSGTGVGNALVVEDDGTGIGLIVQKDGNNDAVQISKTTSGAGIPLVITNAGTGQDVEVANSIQISRVQLRLPTEATGEAGSFASIAGASAAIGNSNGVFDIRGNISQATPSALRGDIRFYVNRDDSLYNAASLISDGAFDLIGQNGQKSSIKRVDGITGSLSGGAQNIASIPEGIILAVAGRITTTFTGTLTSWSLGHGGTPTQYVATNTSLTAGTTSDLSLDGRSAPEIIVAPVNLVLTPNGGTFSAGVFRYSIFYIEITAPTS